MKERGWTNIGDSLNLFGLVST